MQGDYPGFKVTYTDEELAEHFLLTPAERALVDTCRGDVNRHGMAVLLQSLPYLGYCPATLREVPTDVQTFMAHQLGLLWEPSGHYPADARTWRYHLALIRQQTGWRAPTADDKVTLERWLRCEAAPGAPSEAELVERAYARLRTWQIELPAEQELRWVVRTALHGFFHDLYTRVTARLSDTVRATRDQLLVVGHQPSSQHPLLWCGVNSTVFGKHPLDSRPRPHDA